MTYTEFSFSSENILIKSAMQPEVAIFIFKPWDANLSNRAQIYENEKWPNTIFGNHHLYHIPSNACYLGLFHPVINSKQIKRLHGCFFTVDAIFSVFILESIKGGIFVFSTVDAIFSVFIHESMIKGRIFGRFLNAILPHA